jgi:transposase
MIAPMVREGPMTGAAFRAYVEQAVMRALQPGDVVVMDNLAAHKITGIEEAIAAAGANLLYLPPYSPDLNLIEQFFAKLKSLLRKTAARSKEPRCKTAGQLLDWFRPSSAGAISPMPDTIPPNTKMLWCIQPDVRVPLRIPAPLKCSVFRSIVELQAAINPSSQKPMPIPSPSSGPLNSTASLLPCSAGSKC